ncbi:hypothetical protein C8046_08010 [Serinibacter arcticus]|uniref:YdbS-like PH domain-containing protein n=1 Tax=Serinibacter arcticus TaxID=1655435 RepID=A0A2U1ZUK6_9MICO|nr:PH domain-containing protein [Serinibacter arcticus]PWD50602.1 hypothetical protein C8046_08010 [Serinibacter arcticus]
MTDAALPPEPGPAGTPPVDGTAWRRLHRVTPLLNAWKIAAALVVILVIQGLDDLLRIDLPVLTLVLILAGVILVATLIGLTYSYFAWRRTEYAITTEAVVQRSGIFFRKERVARLTRIQAVEVTQPILGRIFGFAGIKVESAGGAEANMSLAYLTMDEASDVRNEILARAAGVDIDSVEDADLEGATSPAEVADAVVGADGVTAPAVDGAAPTGPAKPANLANPARPARPAGRRLAPEAPEHQVFALPAGRLVGSLLAHGATVGVVLGVTGVVVGGLLSGGGEWIFSSLFGLLGAVGFLWSRFSTEFNFRVATSPDGLRVRHGLLETKARTIPPGRIQALTVLQGPIWRRFGWWRARLTLASQGTSSDGTETSDVLLPVGSSDELIMLIRLAVPELEDEDLPVLQAGLTGIDDGEGWVPSPRRARWLDPIAYRRNAFRVLGSVIALRKGRIFRELSIVPHERTQSLGVTQGPLERRLRLVSFTPHSSGSIEPSLPHLDAGVAAQLLVEQAERARSARRSAGPERWMHRDEAADGAAPEPAAGAAPTASAEVGGPPQP